MAKTYHEVTEAFHGFTEDRGIMHPDGPVDDTAIGVVGPVIPIGAIVGVSDFRFHFFNEGGPNNPKPGRVSTATASFTPPDGAASAFVSIHTIIAAYVKDGGVKLTERPLGQIALNLIPLQNQLFCAIQLSDKNGDDPVRVQVRGSIVFFR